MYSSFPALLLIPTSCSVGLSFARISNPHESSSSFLTHQPCSIRIAFRVNRYLPQATGSVFEGLLPFLCLRHRLAGFQITSTEPWRLRMTLRCLLYVSDAVETTLMRCLSAPMALPCFHTLSLGYQSSTPLSPLSCRWAAVWWTIAFSD